MDTGTAFVWIPKRYFIELAGTFVDKVRDAQGVKHLHCQALQAVGLARRHNCSFLFNHSVLDVAVVESVCQQKSGTELESRYDAESSHDTL